MQIAAAQIGNHLQRGLRSLYTVHGDEALLQQEVMDAIRVHAREQGYSERTVHTVAGAHFDWSAVLAAGGSLSLFADRQIVEVRIPSGKPGKEGATALQQLAAQTSENTDTLTLITLPKMDKTSRSTAWFAALEQLGVTVEVQPVERAALPQWLAQRMAQQGQRVEAGEAGQRTLQFFADRVEGNLLAAHQEIQKLALLYPSGSAAPALTLEQISQAVMNVARYDVFKLSEAVLAGKAGRVQRMLEGLRAEGESEVLVHYTLSEDIRALKRVRDAMAQGRPLPMALRENRIWGVRERLFERILPRISDAELAQLLQTAHQVDGVVKGLRQPDLPATGWAALQVLALRLCTLCS